MTTLDLNTQCALAQGWVLVVDEQAAAQKLWQDSDGSHIYLLEDYTPSTDLNQAVDFAEWACDGIAIDSEDSGPRWSVNVVKDDVDYYAKSDHLAEALCHATLAALGKGEKRG